MENTMTIATYATRLDLGSTSGFAMPRNGGTSVVERACAQATVTAVSGMNGGSGVSGNGGAAVRDRKPATAAHARLVADAFIPGLPAWSPPLL